MIVENLFPYDVRVKKEADILKEFYNVTVIALKNKGSKFHEINDSIEIFRIPAICSKTDIHNKFVHAVGYVCQYAWFSLMALVIFMITYIKRRYHIIHAHNPPDTLFFIGLIGKVFGIKYIYDHHDLSPELYLAKFSGKKDYLYQVLLLFEKYSCKVADKIITTNESYKKIEMNRDNIPSEKIIIVRNDPLIDEFRYIYPGAEKQKHLKKNLLFVGSINQQDGLDVLLKALHYLVYILNEKNFRCYIVGDGDSFKESLLLAKRLKLDDYVYFTGLIFERKHVMKYYELADICLEPAPQNALNQNSTFIKIMEYMASHRPIVAFDLPESRYSAEGAALFVQPNNIEDFAHAIRRLLNNGELRFLLGKRGGRKILKNLNWRYAACNLLIAYSSIFEQTKDIYNF